MMMLFNVWLIYLIFWLANTKTPQFQIDKLTKLRKNEAKNKFEISQA
jgi:hypothetical protein